ncbi:MAG: transcriptional repressor LexA [Candidatus Omnitrophica bacterium]|nr:transcriptional repressor LexA [Candidatus Omnitrophota bacterium]
MEKEKLLLHLEKIKTFYFKKKRMPSYSEMLGVFNLSSKNAVFKRVQTLINAGFLEKDNRGKLIPKRPMIAVPLLGSIQAGFPSPAEEELQDVVSLDEYLISNPNATFLVKVQGDSMLDAGIHQDDLVLIQKNLQPKDGDIVIAQVDGEWTLKYFKQKDKKVYLQAANQKYPTIIPRQELSIAGVVIANIRKYK